MRPTKTRTRRRSLPALAVLLIAGGCGGGDTDEVEPPPRPTIERATAEQLASTSDSIADALDAGDVCTAAGRADDLRAQVIEAINARKIPPRFHEDVLARAQELVNTVNCPPPPTTTAADEDDKKKDKKKPKKDDEDGETAELPVEPPPTESLP